MYKKKSLKENQVVMSVNLYVFSDFFTNKASVHFH